MDTVFFLILNLICYNHNIVPFELKSISAEYLRLCKRIAENFHNKLEYFLF